MTVKKINLGLQYNIAAINSLQFLTGVNEWYLQSSLGKVRRERKDEEMK